MGSIGGLSCAGASTGSEEWCSPWFAEHWKGGRRTTCLDGAQQLEPVPFIERNVLGVAGFKLTFKQLHSLLRLTTDADTAVRSSTHHPGAA